MLIWETTPAVDKDCDSQRETWGARWCWWGTAAARPAWSGGPYTRRRSSAPSYPQFSWSRKFGQSLIVLEKNGNTKIFLWLFGKYIMIIDRRIILKSTAKFWWFDKYECLQTSRKLFIESLLMRMDPRWHWVSSTRLARMNMTRNDQL